MTGKEDKCHKGGACIAIVREPNCDRTTEHQCEPYKVVQFLVSS